MELRSESKQSSSRLAADPTDVRLHNTSLLLRLIWQADGISRAQLSRSAGLSRSTVSDIVNSLLQHGLVTESHVARSTGGRPPIVLRFQGDQFVIIGIEMGSSHISALTVDLHGHARVVYHCDHDVQQDPNGALRLMEQLIERCLQASPNQQAIGIGVAVPCPIDPLNPEQLSARILPRWASIRIGDHLQRRFGLSVFVDNDANLGALAELWWGAGKGEEHFAYVKVATGVGAGLIIDGEIYRGSGGIAGEIGHTTIDAQGPLCRCGLHGCLEAVIGTQVLLQAVRAHAAQFPDSPLPTHQSLRLADLVQAANDGDPLGKHIIQGAGRALGIAMANLLNLFNPSRIILSGSLTQAGDALINPIQNTIESRALWDSTTHTPVLISPLGDEAIAIGAATQVLAAAISNPTLFPIMETS